MTIHPELEQLAAHYALRFGHMLIARIGGNAGDFDDVRAVARTMIAEDPDEGALYLAILVALDICQFQPHPPVHSAPSPN